MHTAGTNLCSYIFYFTRDRMNTGSGEFLVRQGTAAAVWK